MSTPTNPWFDGLNGPAVAKIVEEKGDALKERYHTDDVYFALWLYAVDRAVVRRIGIGIGTLEDWGYRDSYDGDTSPVEAALEMLEDNGYAEALS